MTSPSPSPNGSVEPLKISLAVFESVAQMVIVILSGVVLSRRGMMSRKDAVRRRTIDRRCFHSQTIKTTGISCKTFRQLATSLSYPCENCRGKPPVERFSPNPP